MRSPLQRKNRLTYTKSAQLPLIEATKTAAQLTLTEATRLAPPAARIEQHQLSTNPLTTGGPPLLRPTRTWCSHFLASVLHAGRDALHCDDERVADRGVVVVLGGVQGQHLLGPLHVGVGHVAGAGGGGHRLARLDLAQRLELGHLDDVERGEVAAAHGQLLRQRRVLPAVAGLRRQQVGVLRDLQHDVDGALQRLAQPLAKGVQLRLHQHLLVVRRHLGVCLG
mmetsp:Transcript_17993/g.44653  ORF Transcript_17993/g.44653 Transcript_17993/m.44653 type:complete len:224 (-) Transcript_17993:2742-3413(-)